MIIAGAGSGSIPLTNGSGSGSRRPKNMCNRWIQIRIRNHNTLCNILCMIHPIQIRIRIKKKSDPDWHQKIIHLQYNTSVTGIRTTLESFPIISNLKDIMIADWDQLQIRIRIKKKSDPDWHQHIVNLKHFNDRN
jgi:hypothetical protein